MLQSQLTLRCKYCPSKATGINYRPRPQLQNAPTCTSHRTSLYIPYANVNNLGSNNLKTLIEEDNNKENANSAVKNTREINNDLFFQNLINAFKEEVSLMKSEVQKCEKDIKNMHRGDTYDFILQCKVTNPYMLLKQDKQMMMNTVLSRIRNRCEAKSRLRVNSCYNNWTQNSNSRFSNINRQNVNIARHYSPKTQNCQGLTAYSSRIRSDNGSPINSINKCHLFGKDDNIKI